MSVAKRLLERPNSYFVACLLFLLLLIAVGIGGTYLLLVRTEAASVPWGLLVPAYVFFALAATGSSLVNSIFTVYDVKRFKPIIKRGIWLSLMLIIPSWLFIILDLGRTADVFDLYIFWQAGSRMAWMGALYIIFGLSLLVELVVVIREKSLPKWAPVVMGIIVLAATLGVHTNLGALFGAVAANALWYSHILALHFIVSAVLVGAMFHILFMSASYVFRRGSIPGELKRLFFRDYRPLLIGLVILNFVLIAVEFIPGLFSADKAPYVGLLLGGQYSVLFWVLEIAIGGVIPLIILLNRRTKESMGWLLRASVLVIIGVFFSKYNLIVAGQSIGPTFTEEFIPYFAAGADLMLLVGGIAVCLFLYTLGELFLPLDPEAKPKWFIFLRERLNPR